MNAQACLIERSDLSCFANEESVVLIDAPYDHGMIRDFVQDYYEGTIPAEVLRGAHYKLVHYKNSDFIAQKYILNDCGMFLFYEKWIDATASLRKRSEAGSSYFQDLMRQIVNVQRYFSHRKPKEIRVLDYGMGWGHWALVADAAGMNVVGFELSEERLRYAASRGLRTTQDLRAWPDGAFDFINADQVFEHISDPLGAMKDLSRLLSDEGVLHIGVPSGDGQANVIKAAGWQPSKGPVQPLEHINCFSRRALERMAALAKLQAFDYSACLGSEWTALAKKVARFVAASASPSFYFKKA